MTNSVNQFQKPITAKINDAGNIDIGGCDAVELAEKYNTPLYVVDEKTLRTICADYKKAFEKYPKTNIMYASKDYVLLLLLLYYQKKVWGLT